MIHCQKCQNPLLACYCPGAVDRIEGFLAELKGKKLVSNATYNALVNRAVKLLEPKIVANEMEFFSRHSDLRRWPARRRFVLPKAGQKK